MKEGLIPFGDLDYRVGEFFPAQDGMQQNRWKEHPQGDGYLDQPAKIGLPHQGETYTQQESVQNPDGIVIR